MSDAILTQGFATAFDQQPTVVSHAPGRVNLIGEHTDYNQGFVFPAAINFGTWVGASKRNDRNCEVVALDLDHQRNRFALDSITLDKQQGWANYVRGVMKILQETFDVPCGINLAVTGNVPQGAGLSSSASFEMAVLKAVSELLDLDLDGVNAALIGQRAENEFVGCSCGIMDQLISAMGRKDHAMLLDCQSLTFDHSTLPDALHIVIINSNVKRGLVDSEYNLRRQQCEEAAALLGVASLREVSQSMLEAARDTLPDVVYRRARHIVAENQRTHTMFSALKRGDIATVSDAMAASHASMRDDFEITVEPIDYLVSLISEFLGERGGVRMTGGGFGGCVVALVPVDLVADVKSLVSQHYFSHSGLTADLYDCTATKGAFTV
ncbi:galactokinase [Alteromonas halophila]|uniref:Galactokinase n=1 Tax=Alteromonas halophila TaxID=516698 RepID=A0A918JHE9_9ALTE|nr:galactokinase [Alteromonas halophila]GGW81036.1 galactokinase [Alteromonas halophila]